MVRVAFLTALTLGVLSGMTVTQAQTFGDWFAETKSQTALYAATVNDSGNVFGQFCFPDEESCVWLIGLSTACQAGDTYPVLANSDAGAIHLEVLCGGQLESGRYRYAFTDFNRVDNLVRQGGNVGFAVPLQQNEFVVVRFNLRGAIAAISKMRAVAETKTKPFKRGTRDQRM